MRRGEERRGEEGRGGEERRGEVFEKRLSYSWWCGVVRCGAVCCESRISQRGRRANWGPTSILMSKADLCWWVRWRRSRRCKRCKQWNVSFFILCNSLPGLLETVKRLVLFAPYCSQGRYPGMPFESPEIVEGQVYFKISYSAWKLPKTRHRTRYCHGQEEYHAY